MGMDGHFYFLSNLTSAKLPAKLKVSKSVFTTLVVPLQPPEWNSTVCTSASEPPKPETSETRNL